MTKETSYVTAIGSAAIVHQIARACADGNIRSCGCGVNNEYSELLYFNRVNPLRSLQKDIGVKRSWTAKTDR